MTELVLLKSVSKTYGQGEGAVAALTGIDLSIPAGSFVSLHGPSGSGKTTLLNLIGGLDWPTSGEIFVGPYALHRLSQSELAKIRLNSIGFIFQSYNLIPVLSAIENVEFVMQIQGVPAADRRRRAMEILARVGLSGMEDRRPAQLSGGQQQRVAVARAIVTAPKIVLADEPTANLDSVTATGLLELMKQMNEESGVTFVFSTHDTKVMSYAKRLIGLVDGKIFSDESKN